ncbi:MAG: translation elongation factor Ts [Planctomycetota bacterium]
MADVTAAMVKELRDRTSLGMMECKRALVEAQGDVDGAIEVLRKKGAIKSARRAGREAAEGCVQSYIHSNGTVGVMIEVRCETDFVARNEEFQDFVRDVCMHIAWANPVAVDRDSIPDEVIEREKSIYAEQTKDKPEHVVEQILQGKLRDFFERVCLLDQEFVKDGDKSVGDLVTEQAHKFGENIYIQRFVRYEVGEGGD